jgi:hypothetical protein
MQAQTASTIQPSVSLLEKTPAILEILLRDVPQELLHWKPAPDRWSIAEVLAHLAAIELLHESRARRIVREDEPALTKYVAPEESEVQKKSASEQLELFATLRRAFVFYLHSVPSAAGSRAGHHPEMGRITLAQMLNELANHDLGHLRQIAELYRAHAFYPHAGPFQRYSNPKP